MSNVFEQVRTQVTLQQAVEFLGLKLTKIEHGKDGEQHRFPCPHCKDTDQRGLSINRPSDRDSKGFRCVLCNKKGDDATSLVAYVRRIRQREAADLLAEHFLRSSTEPRPAKAEVRERGGTSPDAPASLEHPIIAMLGANLDMLAAIGAEIVGDRVQLPLRSEKGELKGTLGIALKVGTAPLLLFSESVEAEKRQPDELRKLFRIV